MKHWHIMILYADNVPCFSSNCKNYFTVKWWIEGKMYPIYFDINYVYILCESRVKQLCVEYNLNLLQQTKTYFQYTHGCYGDLYLHRYIFPACFSLHLTTTTILSTIIALMITPSHIIPLFLKKAFLHGQVQFHLLWYLTLQGLAAYH